MRTGKVDNLLKMTLIMAAWAVALAAWPGPARGGSVTYIGSLQFASGRYFFDETTTGLYFLNGLALKTGPLTLTATVPLVYQSSPYVSYTAMGVLPSGGSGSEYVRGRRRGEIVILPEVVEFSQVGVGDPMISGGLEITNDSRSLPSIQLTGQVKIPLAGVDQGFGTGAWDYALGAAVSKRLGRTFVFADASYWILGDLPELELKNAWSYAFSIGRAFNGGRQALLVSYTAYTGIITEVAPPKSLGVGLSFRTGQKTTLMLNGSIGLSESSPDFTISVGWSSRL